MSAFNPKVTLLVCRSLTAWYHSSHSTALAYLMFFQKVSDNVTRDFPKLMFVRDPWSVLMERWRIRGRIMVRTKCAECRGLG